MPTTSNFGWTTPADTDLVKDGAAAIRTLGNGIDTSLVDLKGGTTGQNLRKASNTDLDFTFAGDATNTVIDAEGDLLVGDSADTLQRLAIGTNSQVLTVDTALDGKIKWATPSSGKVVQIVTATTNTQASNSTTTYADTNLTATITPTSASNKVLVLVSQNGLGKTGSTTMAYDLRLLRTSTTLGTFVFQGGVVRTIDEVYTNSASFAYLDSPATTSATTYKTQFKATAATFAVHVQYYNPDSSIVLMEVTP